MRWAIFVVRKAKVGKRLVQFRAHVGEAGWSIGEADEYHAMEHVTRDRLEPPAHSGRDPFPSCARSANRHRGRKSKRGKGIQTG